MPNQRQAGLKLVGAYVEEEVKAAIEEIARAKGTDVSDLLREILEHEIRTYGEKDPLERLDRKRPARKAGKHSKG